MKIRVLFLCATNGVQSPMAEALLKRLDSANFDVTSAGIDCGEMHPLAIEVMKEIGVDLERRVPKAMHDVFEPAFRLRYYPVRPCEGRMSAVSKGGTRTLAVRRPLDGNGRHQTETFVSIASRPDRSPDSPVCACSGSIRPNRKIRSATISSFSVRLAISASANLRYLRRIFTSTTSH